MYASPAPRSRSVWADLDALVLEEVNALRTEPEAPAETAAPDFASEEDFVSRVAAYLRGHEDREALLARLSGQLETVEADEDTDRGENSAEPQEDMALGAADPADPAPPPSAGAQEPDQ